MANITTANDYLTSLFLCAFGKACRIDSTRDVVAMQSLAFLAISTGIGMPSFNFRLTEYGVISTEVHDALSEPSSATISFSESEKETINKIVDLARIAANDTPGADVYDIISAIAAIDYIHSYVIRSDSDRVYTMRVLSQRCPRINMIEKDHAYDAYVELRRAKSINVQSVTNYVMVSDPDRFRQICSLCRTSGGEPLSARTLSMEDGNRLYGFSACGRILGLKSENDESSYNYSDFIDELQKVIKYDTLIIQTVRYDADAIVMPQLVIETVTQETYKRVDVNERVKDYVPGIIFD